MYVYKAVHLIVLYIYTFLEVNNITDAVMKIT